MLSQELAGVEPALTPTVAESPVPLENYLQTNRYSKGEGNDQLLCDECGNLKVPTPRSRSSFHNVPNREVGEKGEEAYIKLQKDSQEN